MLAALEQQNGHLPQVEVNEVLRLVGHITAEVTTCRQPQREQHKQRQRQTERGRRAGVRSGQRGEGSVGEVRGEKWWAGGAGRGSHGVYRMASTRSHAKIKHSTHRDIALLRTIVAACTERYAMALQVQVHVKVWKDSDVLSGSRGSGAGGAK